MVDGQIDLLIVVDRLLPAFDQKETELPTVGAGGKVLVRTSVGVIPARARRPGSESVALHLAGRNHRRSLFHGAIVERIDGKAMPMDEVGSGTGVGDVDGDGYTLAQAQERSGNLSVVSKRRNRDAGTNLQRARLDAEGVVGLGGCRGSTLIGLRGKKSKERVSRQQHSCRREEASTIHQNQSAISRLAIVVAVR